MHTPAIPIQININHRGCRIKITTLLCDLIHNLFSNLRLCIPYNTACRVVKITFLIKQQTQVSSIYFWSKNFSHSTLWKNEAEDGKWGSVCFGNYLPVLTITQMLGTKEFKNFYIWYNAVCVDSLIGQIEVGLRCKHKAWAIKGKDWKR